MCYDSRKVDKVARERGGGRLYNSSRRYGFVDVIKDLRVGLYDGVVIMSLY